MQCQPFPEGGVVWHRAGTLLVGNVQLLIGYGIVPPKKEIMEALLLSSVIFD